MTLTNAMVDSGFTYNGHKLFKTSVPGLYYTLSIFNVWSAWVKSNISANGLYIGDAAKQYFSFYVADPTFRGTDVTRQTQRVSIGQLVV